MAPQTDHLVGRAEELEIARSRPGRGRPGQLGGDAARRRAGHRQDAAAGRGRAPARTRAGSSCSPARPPSSSATCPSPSSSMPRRVRARARARAVHRPRRRRPRRARARLPLADGARGRARLALQHERYRSHRAVRSLLEELGVGAAARARARRPALGRPASIELLARSSAARRPRPSCSRWPCAPQVPERLSRALERAYREGTLDPNRAAARSARTRRDELLGDAVRRRDDLYEESGGNPFYLEQLARSLDRAASGRRRRRRPGGDGVPSTVAAALAEELALLSEPERLALEGAAVAGDPFEPELAAAAARMAEA